MACVPKAVINVYLRTLFNLLYTTPLISTCCNTLIDFAIVIYYNYGKDSYFTLFCLKPKNISNSKEMEEEDLFNKLGKDKS